MLTTVKKLFFVLGLFLILTGFSSAQENRTITFIGQAEVILPLYCGDAFVDNIEGEYADAHFRYHYENGKITWRILTLKGSVQSKEGVIFEITAYSTYRNYPIQEAHYNLKGNDGSHYVGSLTYNILTNVFSFSKAKCVGN